MGSTNFRVSTAIAGLTLLIGTTVSSLPSHAASRKLYELDYEVTRGSLVNRKIIKATASNALTELKRCFNCSFPIKNAPKVFPKPSQFIPLEACFLNICKSAPVKVSNIYPGVVGSDGVFRLSLIAQPGHFEGADSTVTFRLYKDKDGLKLKVIAYVTKDPKVLDDAATVAGAKVAWNKFARDLGNNMWANTCKQGKVCGS